MNNNEIEFFDEYKKLDNLCKDILHAEKGVSEYIDEMEKIPISKSRLISSWDDDFKMLKHVRWVRNDIAHNNGNSECEQEDIDFVREFYQRIMNQTDPFGIIYENEKQLKNNTTINKNNSKSSQRVNIDNHNYNKEKYSSSNKYNSICKLLIGIIVIGLIMLIIKMNY